MLAALAGVAVWLVGGVGEAAWALLRVTLGTKPRAAGSSQVCRGDRASQGCWSHPGLGGCCFEPTWGSWVRVVMWLCPGAAGASPVMGNCVLCVAALLLHRTSPDTPTLLLLAPHLFFFSMVVGETESRGAAHIAFAGFFFNSDVKLISSH